MDSYYSRTMPRIVEYCGGSQESLAPWDSEFTVCGREQDTVFRFMGNEDLTGCLEQGADIYRSLWSRRGTLFFFDLEYKNTRDEEEIYRRGPEIFQDLIEPVYRELSDLLAASGVSFLTVMTATGYHFVFAVPFTSSAHARLEMLGHPSPELIEQYGRVYSQGHRSRPVPLSCGIAFDAMGRLTEFLAKELSGDPGIPVQVGLHHSRQIVLDLSTYADPLHMRFLRCVGSYHQKSKHRRFATLIRRHAAGAEAPLDHSLFLMRHPERAAAHIQANAATIPVAGEGMHHLLSRYEASGLLQRHRRFDSRHPSQADMDLARMLLAECSDRELATDAGIKRAVRHAELKGVPAKALASMLAARYRQTTWGSPLMAWAGGKKDGYNPSSRALFWARVFAT